jgi:putative ABC transport system permease protein
MSALQYLKSIGNGLQRVPIAWLQLKYQRNQTISGIVGIFSITLILFIQLGLRNAFLEGALQLTLGFNSDIFLVNAVSSTILQPVPFSSRHLYQALALDTVESVTPFYITSTKWIDRVNQLHRIRVNVIGIPPDSLALDLKGVRENISKIKLENQALFDANSRNEFKPIIDEFRSRGNALAEIQTASIKSVNEVNVAGLFELGVNNAYDATFIVSQNTFVNLFSRDVNKIDIGLIKLKDRYNFQTEIDKTVAELRTYFPKSINIYSKSELVSNERIFHETNSPIGFIFKFTLIGAIFISIFILYQILYVKIANNLENYATLKAIGFSHISLVVIIIQESIMLGIAGYIPGILVSNIAYQYLANVTKISIQMNFTSAISVFGLICLICLISATLSLLKLREADPVDVFS